MEFPGRGGPTLSAPCRPEINAPGNDKTPDRSGVLREIWCHERTRTCRLSHCLYRLFAALVWALPDGLPAPPCRFAKDGGRCIMRSCHEASPGVRAHFGTLAPF